VDSRSQITTISEDFYKVMNPKPELFSIEELNLKVQGAGGHTIPYIGFILCEIRVPFLGENVVEKGALIVPSTEHNIEVPVIVGTIVIDGFKNLCHQRDETQVPEVWNNAFVSLQRSNVGIVKSTNKTDVKIQPMQSITLPGLVRKKDSVEAAVTEQTQGASSRVGVCPRVLSLEKKGNYQRVQVRLFNMSAKVVNIRPRSDLCELHEVKVLRSIDPASHGNETANLKQQHVKKTEEVQDDKEFLKKLDFEGTNITPDQKERVTEFLLKWRSIFSKGITDLGNCDIVKHEIKLSDEVPFKEPHRRIPPAIFHEVREHLKEMIEAGAIRPSTSPYSSNVVIVRKKDGTIRFCVDFRKLNNRTIKDAYAIPRVEETLHLLAGTKYFTKLDLRSGYWQVELREQDKPKTAFQVGTMGFYEFNRMPFGLCNAPATFQRLMERCMGELNLRD
ncbi:MAG: reverse transcriptase family protein, partial [Candidatus Thiodiazotropha taylori]|nr:reverse transcriptase family protein [Candidatus Thiodiazotropha taylori]MCW4282603.1 reverse transcriptase family protein [Candidatus Thiodiazotropha taylori]